MGKVAKLSPTGHLRFVPIKHSPSDERVPTMVCGIHHYKLQQKWLGTDSSVMWADVQIDHDQDAPELETSDVLSVVRARLAEVQGRIDQGKGEWPKPGYVRDETWAEWHGEAYALRYVLNVAERHAATKGEDR
jgi:hypothetical protein